MNLIYFNILKLNQKSVNSDSEPFSHPECFFNSSISLLVGKPPGM